MLRVLCQTNLLAAIGDVKVVVDGVSYSESLLVESHVFGVGRQGVNFLYGIFENVDEITAAHAKGAELDLNFAASYTAVPYHKGAVKYFGEKGIKVAGK